MPEQYEDGLYYTYPEVAELLEVTERTVKNLVIRGDLLPTKTLKTKGNPKLFHERDVRAYVQKRYGER